TARMKAGTTPRRLDAFTRCSPDVWSAVASVAGVRAASIIHIGDGGKVMVLRLLLVSLCACLALSLPARADYQVQTVAEGLEHPWSLAFLPGGRMLVTERPGRLRVIEDGQLREAPIEGVPPVFASGQSVLLEVLPAERLAVTGSAFLSVVHGDKPANHTRIGRARFDGERLNEVEPIVTTRPAKSGDVHGGGRMLFLPDGTLLMSM